MLLCAMSTCFVCIPPLKGENMSDISMERFINRQNLARYQKLLDDANSDSERHQLLQLLNDEKSKENELVKCYLSKLPIRSS